MTERGTRAGNYLRQSLDMTGEEKAISRQREDNVQLATRRGWTIVAEYPDNDRSASGKQRRPHFEQLLEDVEAGKIDIIIAWSLDRLTRNRPDTVRLIDICAPRGVTIALVRGSDFDMSTPAGRLTADILASVARHEIEVKGDRQRRAARQRAEAGRPPLGPRLMGYTAEGNVLKREAKTIGHIFDRFKCGDSVKGIAGWLTDKKTATRYGGTKWSPSTVSGILTNPRYAGRVVYDGAVKDDVTGTWKAIVDDETFELVQARIKDPRRKTHHGTDRKHLGSGLYLCGCGRRLTGWTRSRYACPDGCLTRSLEPIDKLVIDVIRKRLARGDFVGIVSGDDSEQGKQAAADVARLNKRLAKIAADYDAELIDGHRFKTATEKVRAELATASTALARLTVDVGAAGILTAPNPVAEFDAANLMIQRNVIAALCTITVHPAVRGRRAFDPETVRIDWRRRR